MVALAEAPPTAFLTSADRVGWAHVLAEALILLALVALHCLPVEVEQGVMGRQVLPVARVEILVLYSFLSGKQYEHLRNHRRHNHRYQRDRLERPSAMDTTKRLYRRCDSRRQRRWHRLDLRRW